MSLARDFERSATLQSTRPCRASLDAVDPGLSVEVVAQCATPTQRGHYRVTHHHVRTSDGGANEPLTAVELGVHECEVIMNLVVGELDS